MEHTSRRQDNPSIRLPQHEHSDDDHEVPLRKSWNLFKSSATRKETPAHSQSATVEVDEKGVQYNRTKSIRLNTLSKTFCLTGREAQLLLLKT